MPDHERISATDDKILAALAALSERVAKNISLLRGRIEIKRMLGAVERGMFASALGVNMRARPMAIYALMESPEQILLCSTGRA